MVSKKGDRYIIYAGGKKAELVLLRDGGSLISGELIYPLADEKLEEVKRAVEIYEKMRKEGTAPPPSAAAQDGWLLSNSVTVEKDVIIMETTSLEQVVIFLSAFGVSADEIHWGRGKRRGKPVKIDIPYFKVTSEGLRPVYRVELHGKYAEEVWDRLSAARRLSEEEKRAVIDFIMSHLDGEALEKLDINPEEFRRKLEKWLSEM